MSCEGCHISGHGQNIALNNAINQAAKYAKENEITVAVYKEGYEFNFIAADTAVAGGYQIIQFISQHYGTAT